MLRTLKSLSHNLKSSFQPAPRRSILGLGGIWNTLSDNFKHAVAPGPARHNPHTMEMTETELMDEDAHELQAMITHNTFDVEIMGGDVNTQRNFGTVDNPVILFSANVGWRYVMCSGMNDEDEGSSHSPVWFILREGPQHRCPCCGQVFKLINLKDAIHPDNDYYMEHYMPILEEEMGDDDEMITRWTFHKFAEPYAVSMPHQNTGYAYVIVNSDEHDRILTDPAYRIQKLHESHEKLHELHSALLDVEDRLLWQNGGFYPKVEYTPEDYKDLVTAETAIRKLDRIFEKVQQFSKRSVLDPDNHERREKRMLERSAERSKNLTIYSNTNELEQQYKDYYETDYDSEDELVHEQQQYEELVCNGLLNFNNYEFVQEGVDNPVPAVMGTFEKKVFKFSHRKWNDDPETHYIREARMIRRYLGRMRTRDPAVETSSEELLKTLTEKGFNQAVEAAKPWRQYVVEEAVQQYKDYYESDEEDLKDFEYITPEEKLEFSQVFKDYSRPLNEPKQVISLKGLEQTGKVGFFKNFTEQLSDVRSRLLPQARLEAMKVAAKYHGPSVKGSEFKLPQGKPVKLIENLDEVFEDYIHQAKEDSDVPQIESK